MRAHAAAESASEQDSQQDAAEDGADHSSALLGRRQVRGKGDEDMDG